MVCTSALRLSLHVQFSSSPAQLCMNQAFRLSVRCFSTTSSLSIKRAVKMPPKKAAAAEKKIILGRASNSLSMVRRFQQSQLKLQRLKLLDTTGSRRIAKRRQEFLLQHPHILRWACLNCQTEKSRTPKLTAANPTRSRQGKAIGDGQDVKASGLTSMPWCFPCLSHSGREFSLCYH